MAKTNIPLRIKGTLSFPALLEPKAIGDDPNAKKRFSVQVLVPKSDKAQIDAINEAVAAVKKAEFPKGFPKTANLFVQDGADYIEGREARGKEADARLKDYVLLSVNTGAGNPPTVLNSLRERATANDIFAGETAWVAFNVYSYKEPSVGIAAGLNGVLLSGNVGPLGRLDGKPSAEQLFGDIPNEELAPAELATAAPVGAGEGEFSV